MSVLHIKKLNVPIPQYLYTTAEFTDIDQDYTSHFYQNLLHVYNSPSPHYRHLDSWEPWCEDPFCEERKKKRKKNSTAHWNCMCVFFWERSDQYTHQQVLQQSHAQRQRSYLFCDRHPTFILVLEQTKNLDSQVFWSLLKTQIFQNYHTVYFYTLP